jgi:hypothetical protein
VQLLRDKWDRTWHWFEIPNNDDFYYMRAQVPVLRWLPVTFWLIAPLALVGLVLAVTRIRVAWTLYLIVASVVAPLVLFYVLGRFRTALVAAALPFAAYAAVPICSWISEPGRRVRGAAAAAAVVLLLAIATGRPLPPGVPLIRPDDWMIPYVLEYGDRITSAMEAGDSDKAIAAFTGLFAYEPPPADLDPLTGGEVADAFARMHDDCAELFRKSGRIPQADAHAARASEFRSPGRLLAR